MSYFQYNLSSTTHLEDQLELLEIKLHQNISPKIFTINQQDFFMFEEVRRTSKQMKKLCCVFRLLSQFGMTILEQQQYIYKLNEKFQAIDYIIY